MVIMLLLMGYYLLCPGWNVLCVCVCVTKCVEVIETLLFFINALVPGN